MKPSFLTVAKLLLSLFVILYVQDLKAFSCQNYFLIKTYEQLHIPLEQFSDLTVVMHASIPHKLQIAKAEIPNQSFVGLGTELGLVGVLNGQKVFIKFPSRTDTFEQIPMYHLLGVNNLGPKVLGTTTYKNLKGIILEYIDGIHLTSDSSIPRNALITEATYRRAQAIRERLISLKLVAGYDLQFRLTTDGKLFIIDPEKIRFARSERELQQLLNRQHTLFFEKNILSEINMFIEKLEHELYLRGIQVAE